MKKTQHTTKMSFADLARPIGITSTWKHGHSPRRAVGCSPSRASPSHGRGTASPTQGGSRGGFSGGGQFFLIHGFCLLQEAGRVKVYFARICASCRQGFFRKITLPLLRREFFSMIHLKEELIPVWLAMQGFSNRKVEAGLLVAGQEAAKGEPGVFL